VNKTVLTLSLVGVAVYFAVLILRDLVRYARFRRVRRTALVTWRNPLPMAFWLLLMLGAINLPVAAVTLLSHPWPEVVSPLAIALYFLGILPLLARIPMGFYGEGIWAEGGFVPYNRIRRLAFSEGPELVLLLLPWGRGGAFRLQVPPAEYGAVRKVLGEKIRSQVMNLEGGILGLEASHPAK
jgi:hypothetical protein